MRFGRFFWKLFLGNAALLVLVLVTCVYFILAEFQQLHEDELATYLRTRAQSIRPETRGKFDPVFQAELSDIARTKGTTPTEGIRITFLAPDGSVLADSTDDETDLVEMASMPEVREALRKGWGESRRWSITNEQELRCVAIRVGSDSEPEGVILLSVAVQRAYSRPESAAKLAWTIVIITTVASVSLALGLAVLWTRRISWLTRAARQIARGDLSRRVIARGSDEIAELARALNEMRGSLSTQLETIDRHRRMLELLLGQLHEGVLVARPDGRIALINPEARRMLNIAESVDLNTSGNSLMVEQCVRVHELQKMLLLPTPETPPGSELGGNGKDKEISLSRSSFEEARLELSAPNGRTSVLARAEDIILEYPDSVEKGRWGRQDGVGRLLVLTDITELTKMIEMKTDFVANASHELRTPLSAIRAAVETLLSLDLKETPEFANRFLEVIDRHSVRLEELVGDLLDLSRLESEESSFKPSTIRVTSALRELRDRWVSALEEKGLQWRTNVAEDCEKVEVNFHLLQMVLDNLVSNAAKFTASGGYISVNWKREDNAIAVEVEDNGCGIPPKEQQRVFERFYQVARDRAGGMSATARRRGTGLGLAIVRHAVNAMGGSVSLQSEVDKGTRVCVRIPQPR